jgi:triacylglycerol lipase
MGRSNSLRRAVALLSVLAALAVVPPPAPAEAVPPAPAAVREPVIVVPGFLEWPQAMETLRSRFAAAGYPAYVVNLNNAWGVPTVNSRVNGPRVALAARWALALHPDAERVNVVGVSYGGVASRYWMRSLDGLGLVRNYVALGTPERGAPIACGVEPYDDYGHLCPGSPFMRALNAGDDTPGDVRYTSIISEEDPALTRLDGVVCRVTLPGVPHFGLQDSPDVFQAALAAIEGAPCPDLFTGTVADP